MMGADLGPDSWRLGAWRSSETGSGVDWANMGLTGHQSGEVLGSLL